MLYIDDLKILAASQTKIAIAMKSTQTAMKDMRLRWNLKNAQYSTSREVYNKKITTQSNWMNHLLSNRSSSRATIVPRAGILENIKHEDLLALKCASREYLKRLSVIWSSPLSDVNKASMPSRY